MDLTKEELAERAKVEAMFGDRTSFINALPEPERVRALGYIDSTDDPAEQENRRMWMANVHAMATAFKLSAKDVATRYDQLQLQYTAQVFGDPVKLTPAEFHGRIKERIEKSKALRTEYDAVETALIQSFMDEARPDFDRTFTNLMAEREKIGKPLDAESRTQLRRALAGRWDDMAANAEKYSDAIGATVAYFEKNKAAQLSTVSPETSDALMALQRLDPKAQDFVIQKAAHLSKVMMKAQPEDSWLGKLAKRTGRNISDLDRAAAQTISTIGGKVVSALGGTAQDAAMAKATDKFADIERRLSGALQGYVDPAKGDSWASEALLGAASGVPRLGISVTPPGIAVNMAAYYSETKGELLDRGVPENWAAGMATVGAPIMAALDYASAGISLKGWVPGGKTLVQKFTSQLAKGAATAGIQFGEQFTFEMAQDAVAPVLQGLAASIDDKVPAVDVMAEWTRLKESAPETAGVMLVYTLLGTSHARWADRQAERMFLAQKEFILANGYSEQVADQVVEMAQEAETPEDNEAIKDVLRENLPNRDLTTPVAQEAQAQISEQAQTVDLSNQPKTDGTPASDTALEPRWTDDGTIQLLDAGGTVVAEASSAFEAAEIALRYQGKQWKAQPEAALPPTEPPTVPPQGESIPVPQPAPQRVRLVQEEIDQLRRVFPKMALEDLPAPERESVAGWLEQAKQPNEQGRSEVDDAEITAKSVLLRPRSLTKVEQAGLVVRTAQLHNEYQNALSDAAASTGNPIAFEQAQARLAAARNSYDLVTHAAKIGGTEWGRAGAARRWTAVDLETFDLVSMVQRIEAAKGGEKIAPEVLAELKEAADAHKKTEEEIAKIETKQCKEADQQAEEDVKTFVAEARAGNKPASKGRKAKKKATREELLGKLRELGFDPEKGGELTPAVADIVAKLGEIQVEEGAKTLADIEGRMKQDVPALSNDEIHRAFAGKIAEEAEPKKAVEARIAEFKKQAGLWADIHAILESGELEQKGDKPVSSEKVQQLREILAKLRLGLMKTEMDDAKFEALQKKINEVQDQIDRGFRTIQEPKEAEAARIEAARVALADVRRQLGLTDIVYDLEDRLRRMDFSTPEKADAAVSAEVAALQDKVNGLRKQLSEAKKEAERPAKEAAKEAAKLDDLLAKLEEAKTNYKQKTRSIPEAKAKPEQSEAVKKVEAEIRRLEKVMSVEDSIFDLEDKLQRKGPPEQKRRVEEDDQLFMLHRKRLELRRRLARIEEAERPLTAWRGIGATAEFMRASKATADFSSMFRQAIVLAPMRPIEFTKSAATAMKAFFDSEYADRLDFEMRRKPQHIWRERAGLFLSSIDSKMTGREEAFTSSWAERMPVFGAVVRGSNRHMVTMLNQMRVAAFDSFREANLDADMEVMTAMARYVNIATGRGELRGFEPVAGVLAKLAFSPRFVASRIQMLGSPFYFAAKYKDKRVAMVATKDMLAFTAAGMSVLTLAHLAGAQVGLDPEDSFFGKMRFGKVTIDLWGGLQQPVALLAKAAVKGGDRVGVIESNKDINVLDAGIRFLMYKASPGISSSYAIAMGEDIIGTNVGFTEALLRSVTPMTLETVYETWQATEGDVAATLAATAASASGVGVQVYEDKKKQKAKLRKVD